MAGLETALHRPGVTALGGEHALPGVSATAQEIEMGRNLAQLELEEIITKVKRWVSAGRLNRGLRLSLPFYNDQTAEMSWLEFDIIPTGRVMFVPAFVVLAVHREAQKIRSASHWSESTRTHLLTLLRTLQEAFGPVPEKFRI